MISKTNKMLLVILLMTFCVHQSVCTSGEKIYECTFDLTFPQPQYCGGKTKQTGSPSISSTTSVSATPNKITDVTSISKKYSVFFQNNKIL